MQLNFECVRSLILHIEKIQKFKANGLPKPIHLKHIYNDDEISRFSPEDINYAAYYLVEKGLILLSNASNPMPAPKLYVFGNISAKGCDYIAAIKDKKIWDKIKEKIGTTALASVPIVIEMATKLLTNGTL
jgi:hypothetical protein